MFLKKKLLKGQTDPEDAVFIVTDLIKGCDLSKRIEEILLSFFLSVISLLLLYYFHFINKVTSSNIHPLLTKAKLQLISYFISTLVNPPRGPFKYGHESGEALDNWLVG